MGFDGTHPAPERYWRRRCEPAAAGGAGWHEQAGAVLREAVATHLVSDVPLGVFCSGGIDSALVAMAMSEVLEETFGIMVYQEQVSRLVNRLGGIELKEAFRLAKAISKKKTDMIEAMREPFVKGCEGNGLARATAAKIFTDIRRFGGSAFNKGHSTGYALIPLQRATIPHH